MVVTGFFAQWLKERSKIELPYIVEYCCVRNKNENYRKEYNTDLVLGISRHKFILGSLRNTIQ